MLKEPWGEVRGHPPHAATISLTLAGIQYDQSQGALTSWVSRVAEKQNLNPRSAVSGPKLAPAAQRRPSPPSMVELPDFATVMLTGGILSFTVNRLTTNRGQVSLNNIRN